jgi:hypothetical protein
MKKSDSSCLVPSELGVLTAPYQMGCVPIECKTCMEKLLFSNLLVLS